jgi:hypothetical protein
LNRVFSRVEIPFRVLRGSLFKLLMLDGGFLMCHFLVASDFNLFAITPFIQAGSPATYGEFRLLLGEGSWSASISIGLMILLSHRESS